MNLYTVVLESKHIVSVFDAKGKKVSERTELIKQTITDLPHSTALMYQSKDAGRVTVIKQDMTGFGERRGSSARQRHERRTSVDQAVRTPAARPTTTTSNVQKAAASGNLIAAINAKD